MLEVTRVIHGLWSFQGGISKRAHPAMSTAWKGYGAIGGGSGLSRNLPQPQPFPPSIPFQPASQRTDRGSVPRDSSGFSSSELPLLSNVPRLKPEAPAPRIRRSLPSRPAFAIGVTHDHFHLPLLPAAPAFSCVLYRNPEAALGRRWMWNEQYLSI